MIGKELLRSANVQTKKVLEHLLKKVLLAKTSTVGVEIGVAVDVGLEGADPLTELGDRHGPQGGELVDCVHHLDPVLEP